MHVATLIERSFTSTFGQMMQLTENMLVSRSKRMRNASQNGNRWFTDLFKMREHDLILISLQLFKLLTRPFLLVLSGHDRFSIPEQNTGPETLSQVPS